MPKEVRAHRLARKLNNEAKKAPIKAAAKKKTAKKDNRGGPRANSGCKPGENRGQGRKKKLEEPGVRTKRELFQEFHGKYWEDYQEALRDLATGFLVEAEGPDGQVRLYARPPDRAALQYIINRLAGPPPKDQDDVDPPLAAGQDEKPSHVVMYLPERRNRVIDITEE